MSENLFDAVQYEQLLLKSIEKTITKLELKTLANLIILSLYYPEDAERINEKLMSNPQSKN